jgi:preprotein translocase subunit YajC
MFEYSSTPLVDFESPTNFGQNSQLAIPSVGTRHIDDGAALEGEKKLLAITMFPSEGQGGGPAGTFIMLFAFIAIFYFLLIRPQRQQQKRHNEMVQSLRRGDEVATVGGIIGRVIHVKDDRITIKTADDTRLVVERDKIARTLAAAPEEDES